MKKITAINPKFSDGPEPSPETELDFICQVALPYLRQLAALSPMKHHHDALKIAERRLGIKTHCPTCRCQHEDSK